MRGLFLFSAILLIPVWGSQSIPTKIRVVFTVVGLSLAVILRLFGVIGLPAYLYSVWRILWAQRAV